MPVLYFAYGSNMSPSQMARRCPGARLIGPATLEDWRLIITVRGSANIIRQPDGRVEGALWRFEPRHIGLMDQWEGVSRRVYRRSWLRVQMANGHSDSKTTLTALTYVCTTRWPGYARTSYVETAMVPGARALNLSASYIEEIQSWLADYPLAGARLYTGRRAAKSIKTGST